MLLLTNAGLQYLDTEINFLNFLIISGEISGVTRVIIEGIKNKEHSKPLKKGLMAINY